MRRINKIIIHCTDTPEDRHVSVKDITQWHKARGFHTIGYHYVVYLDGSVHAGRLVDDIGAHCKGHNADSIGICYVGGRDKKGDYCDTRTPEQKQALAELLTKLKAKYPGASIHGHNEFAHRACPCFNAKKEYADL
jgi:N-acetylmuramoyl-L-alanine amidase